MRMKEDYMKNGQLKPGYTEGVFSMIREDMNFRRIMMRGKKNVNVERHLVSMAYNILI